MNFSLQIKFEAAADISQEDEDKLYPTKLKGS